MPKHNPHRFRLERASELTRLAEILKRNRVCNDLSPLYGAAAECRTRGDDRWGYSLDRLLFRIRDAKNPVPAKAYDITLAFSINLTGHCREDGEIRDPLHTLEFNLVLTGKHDEGESTNTVMCSWHLDRDLPPGFGGAHEFIHPCYHFQHGGRHTWGSGLNFGAALILESPRFAHPPMDAILGIDFILTNFIKSSDLNFRYDSEYRNLLKTSQMLLWRPYVQSLLFAWKTIPQNSNWPFTSPWPQLV